MKKINYLYKTSLLLLVSFCMQGCKYEIEDIEKVQEELRLQASSTEVVLDADHLKEGVITFTWTDARSVVGENILSYTTKLDVVGNNFGTSTAIMTSEDEGVFSRSFTSEQLQNWANEKWELPVNKPFTLEFRVVAQWEGGNTFEAPEVRTIRVDVQPIRTVVFDADKVFLNGSAVPSMGSVEMSRTLENEDQYAFLMYLEAGELEIPVEFNGKTNYICPADGDGSLHDGEAVGIDIREKPITWKIEDAGEYRVVVNMQSATATIYSPDKALQPKTVVWMADGETETTTEIQDLWMHGDINDWGTPVKMECTVSLADPQILVYTGGRAGKTKFIVYGGSDNNKNLAYAFSCPLTAAGTQQELSLALNKISELSGGYTSAQRNSYYTIPSEANLLIINLREMTILAENR